MSVKYYRVYSLDRADNIFKFADFECENDYAALLQAVKLFDGQALEVWHLGRRLARLLPGGTMLRTA